MDDGDIMIVFIGLDICIVVSVIKNFNCKNLNLKANTCM